MESSTAASIPLVDLKAQFESIRSEVLEALESVILSTEFIGGPALTGFETAFAEYCEIPNVVGVANGTDALELVLAALGIGPGDEVLVPTLTFAATVEAVVSAGATPVFVDCDSQTMNISPRAARAVISPSSRALVAVHLYGQPADMDALSLLAGDCGLHLIEDAAQAHGARWRDKPVGSFGVATTFSFYPGKNLGAYGDAGAVVTHDAALAERVRMIADHGRISKYEHKLPGRNSRLDSLQAAILQVKLRHLPQWTMRRRAIAGRYKSRLREHVQIVHNDPRAWSVYHLFVVLVEQRDAVRSLLRERGIATGVHYPVPLHGQPAFSRFAQARRRLSWVADAITPRLLSLPLYPELADQDADRIADSLLEAIVCCS